MKFYTNIFKQKNKLFLRGFDRFGKRESKVINYQPTLYVPSPKDSEFKTLAGKSVSPMKFDSIYEANQFLNKYKDVAGFSIFGYTGYEYVFLSEEFKNLDPDVSKISIGYIDIEVNSTEGFPLATEAKHEVTAITIIKNNKVYILSTKPYKTLQDDEVFFLCKSELDLLGKFIILWEKLDLDVITGWYIEGFDIPYLINRITNTLGHEQASRLSPWRRIYSRESVDDFGNTMVYHTIQGIAILDYKDLYKKFTQNERDSYSLDNIAKTELGEEKLDYSEYSSLAEMWEKNPQKYIHYNIHDTRLVAKLERKMRFLELVFAIAYDAKVNFQDAMGSVLLWEVISMNYLSKQNIVMPVKSSPGVRTRIEGAYVKPPIVGLHDWIVSFDLTSLYPHIIIAWNISPETFNGKGPQFTIDEILTNTNASFSGEHAITANSLKYSKKTQGFLGALMESQFEARNKYKKKMIDLKKKRQQIEEEMERRGLIC